MKTNATLKQLKEGVDKINEMYDGNVFLRANLKLSKQKGARFFALFVKDLKGPGAKRQYKGKTSELACWHVHKDFFEYMTRQDEGLYFKGLMGMVRKGDACPDREVSNGRMMSEDCRCEKRLDKV